MNDPWLRVQHMRDHAVEAVQLMGAKSADDLLEDRPLQLALLQLIQIVGEATSNISQDFRDTYTQIPWRAAADTRNRLIHGYYAIDHFAVWSTIVSDFPPLIDELERLLASQDN
jgi:uncharacterized protein with HEPN domain